MERTAETAAAPPADPQAAALGGITTRGKSRDFKKSNVVGYLFVSPWIIGFMVFTFVPIAISLWLAFTNYRGAGSWEYVGLDNFQRMFFEDIRYGRSMSATVKYVILAVPLRLLVALGVALLLNTKRNGVYWYRAAFYIPSVIGGSVAVAVMWRQIFGNNGLINALMGTVGLEPVSWLGNPDTAIWTLVLLAMWQFGSPMLIFLAGLRQIPSEYHEAAAIDGASKLQRFWRITLPLLTPIIFFNVIMQLIAGFRVFTQAFVVTGGAPLDTTLFYSLYVFNRAFGQNQFGYAAAMAWVLVVIIGVLTFINFRLSARWVFYETKEA
jgi:multiple sugar transport system permease protein